MQVTVPKKFKVLVTGAAGMLGKSVIKALRQSEQFEVVPWTRKEVDLRNYLETLAMLNSLTPDFVIHCAARVGGIQANVTFPVDFLLENIQLDSSILSAAQVAGVQNFVYLGSSCMYPKDFRQPLVEEDLLAAPLEETNEGYALAKIVGSKLAEYISRQYGRNFKTLIPSNLYGPGDSFDQSSSHLVAACIGKAYEAKLRSSNKVYVWGDGQARREFTFVDELSEWLVSHLFSISSWPSVMNLGLGIDFTVAEFYNFALEAVDHKAELVFEPEKPSGMQQKLMDSSMARNNFGWNPKIMPLEGIKMTLESMRGGT